MRFPSRLGWLLEWLTDLWAGLFLYFFWYGWRVFNKHRSGAISIKTLFIPEWGCYPLPLAFSCLQSSSFPYSPTDQR